VAEKPETLGLGKGREPSVARWLDRVAFWCPDNGVEVVYLVGSQSAQPGDRWGKSMRSKESSKLLS
jgi:hypothetical protein